MKIEDLSTRMLIQEEAKANIMKQLRYWQYKAACSEVQIIVVIVACFAVLAGTTRVSKSTFCFLGASVRSTSRTGIGPPG